MNFIFDVFVRCETACSSRCQGLKQTHKRLLDDERRIDKDHSALEEGALSLETG